MQISKLSIKGFWSVLFLSFFLVLTFPIVSKAADFNVTRIDDPTPGPCNQDDCSLREAVSAANASSDFDNTINLQTNTPYTLTQTGSDDTNVGGDLDLFPLIFSNLTINGNGSTVTQTVAGERIFDANNQFINVTLNNMVITGGDVTGTASSNEGGGIQFAVSGSLGFATLNLNNVWVFKNSAKNGGGVSVKGAAVHFLTHGSTISGNHADSDGGGLYAISSITDPNNSTISDNTAGGSGGGIGGSLFTMKARNITVNNNSAALGGGFSGTDATLDLKNSILFGNSPEDCASNGSSFIFISNGFNILGNIDASCLLSGDPTDKSDNPLLQSLADNGGPTQTQLLGDGSPAIDGGDPAGCTDTLNDAPLTIDQRGVPRPQGAACDIGAVEMIICGDGTLGPNESFAEASPPEQCDGGECCTDKCQFADSGTSCDNGQGQCNSSGDCNQGGGTATGGTATGGTATGGTATGGTATGGTATGGTATAGTATGGTNSNNGGCSLATQSFNGYAITIWGGILAAVAGMVVLRRRRS